MEYVGNSVSKGIAAGAVYLYTPFQPEAAVRTIAAEECQAALARYDDACRTAGQELERLRVRLGDAEEAKIFAAHADILRDEAMAEDIRAAVTYDLLDPSSAVATVFDQYTALLDKAPDPLIRERTSDMRDVKTRLLRCLAGVAERSLSALDAPVVVVARDLFPSDTASLDRSKVLAIVTEVGGATSHSAIIARSYEIPALLGVAGITEALNDGEAVVVDALEGKLITAPTPEQLETYEVARRAWRTRAADMARYLDAESVTRDGTPVHIALNVGSANDAELSAAAHVEGVGLFRTEFLYMGRAKLPTEEEQYEIYRRVLTAFAPHHVTLRTLDIGGDKKLDCLELPKEENPFLGNRALRLCFSMEELFLTQLRAALRAAAHGELWLMFPMVGSLDDIRRVKKILEKARVQLDAEGVPYGRPKVGVMIEIPALALMSDLVAKEVDFASIGTNDLTQYALAVDRVEPSVAGYYQMYHPAVFRLIREVSRQFTQAEKHLCVCGELGGDPLAAAALIGLGLRNLSMGAASLPALKKLVCGLDMELAHTLGGLACSLPTAGEVEKALKDALSSLL